MITRQPLRHQLTKIIKYKPCLVICGMFIGTTYRPLSKTLRDQGLSENLSRQYYVNPGVHRSTHRFTGQLYLKFKRMRILYSNNDRRSIEKFTLRSHRVLARRGTGRLVGGLKGHYNLSRTDSLPFYNKLLRVNRIFLPGKRTRQ